MKANEHRSAIIFLCKVGKSQASIVKDLKLCKSTISRAIKRYQELGNGEDCPGRGRPVTATTPKNREIIR